MSTLATCVYTINARGKTPAQLNLLMNAGTVPVDPAILTILGITVSSDNTVSGGSSTARTIVLNLTPTFKTYFPDGTDQTAPFWNFMTNLISTSARSPVVAAAPVLS
jgi:hypothetical protein